MVYPALNTGIELGKAGFSGTPFIETMRQTPRPLHYLARLDTPVGGIDDKTEPGNSRRHRRHLCAVFVLDLPEQLYAAQSSRGERRLQALSQADASLNKLRLYLRLAHRWRWISDGQYQHASRMVAEIGRLLGGWLRQASRQQG